MADEAPARRRQRREVAKADREAALGPGVVDRDQRDVGAGGARRPTSSGTTLTPRLAATTRSAASKPETTTRYGDRAPGAARRRAAASCAPPSSAAGRRARSRASPRSAPTRGRRARGRRRRPARAGRAGTATRARPSKSTWSQQTPSEALPSRTSRTRSCDRRSSMSTLMLLVVGLAHERGDVVEQRLGDRRRGRDQAHVALHAAGEGSGIGDDAIHREEDAARVLEQRQSGRRRLHAAPPAHQELDAEVVLELGDALADRRRLDVLLLGGARHRAAVGDRDEQAKRLEVDVAHAADDRR